MCFWAKTVIHDALAPPNVGRFRNPIFDFDMSLPISTAHCIKTEPIYTLFFL